MHRDHAIVFTVLRRHPIITLVYLNKLHVFGNHVVGI